MLCSSGGAPTGTATDKTISFRACRCEATAARNAYGRPFKVAAGRVTRSPVSGNATTLSGTAFGEPNPRARPRLRNIQPCADGGATTGTTTDKAISFRACCSEATTARSANGRSLKVAAGRVTRRPVSSNAAALIGTAFGEPNPRAWPRLNNG